MLTMLALQLAPGHCSVLYSKVLLLQLQSSLQCVWPLATSFFLTSHLTHPQQTTHSHVQARRFGKPTSTWNSFEQLFFLCKTYAHMHINWPPSSAFVHCWPSCLFNICGLGHLYVLFGSSYTIISHRQVISDKWHWITKKWLFSVWSQLTPASISFHTPLSLKASSTHASHLHANIGLLHHRVPAMIQAIQCGPAHPLNMPLIQDTRVLAFHMVHVETCDASCALCSHIVITSSPAFLGQYKLNCSKLARYVDDRHTGMVPKI